MIPERVRTAISRRFEYEDIEHSGAPYDMIRATVNLTTSALLIALATSLKLPSRPPTSASWSPWVRRSPTAPGAVKAPSTASRAS